MKSKLKGAQVGHDLLKRKSEALTKRFRDITKRIDEAKRKMGRVMQIAAFSLAEVTYAVGNNTIGYQITESVRQAKFRVRTKQENVSGVFLPQFESFQMEGGSDFQMTGLGRVVSRWPSAERRTPGRWRLLSSWLRCRLRL